MSSLWEQVLDVFYSIQETSASHPRNVHKLRKIYESSDFNEFWKAFSHPINIILEEDYRQKSIFVDRVIDFTSQFCASVETQQDKEPLLDEVFNHLLQASQNPWYNIRFRACELINKILDQLAGNEISDELYENLSAVLTDRLWDPKVPIRLQAIATLHRLQDPKNQNDPLINEFINMTHDRQAKVRQLSVEKIAYRRDVINVILKRSRDADVNVRLAAFKRLTKYAKLLKITDRRLLLLAGIYDKSEKVRKYISTAFLTSWWESYDFNILDLMKSVRLDGDEKDIEATAQLYSYILEEFYFKNRTLKELIEILPINEEKFLPFDAVNYETITYWTSLITLLNKDDDDSDMLEPIIPEVVFFCRYVKEYSEHAVDDSDESYLTKQFILKKLFDTIRTYDFSDTYSGQIACSLVDFILKKEDLLDDTLEALVGILEKTSLAGQTKCLFGMKIISDILNPIDVEENQERHQEREFLLSKLKVQVGELQHNKEKAIRAEDFIEAERLKRLIEDASSQLKDLENKLNSPVEDEANKKTDIPTICKCLNIVWAFLRSSNVMNLTPTMRSIKNNWLPEYLIHENHIVREKAFRCYAICCIYDKPTAQQGIHMFAIPIAAYQAGEECYIHTLVTCIEAVSDLMRMYGADLLAEPSENLLSESVNEEHQKIFAGGTSLTSLTQGLVDLMNDELYDIQLQACQGLCKLLLEERIHSSPLISRLILKWCNPVDDDEGQSRCIKQFIGHVLEKIPHLPSGAQQLEGAILLTIDILLQAPKSSPLAEVNIENIAKFLLALCKVSSKAQTLNSNIALALCKKISQNPDSKANAMFSKILLMIDLPKNREVLEEIFLLIDDAREYISGKATLKNITKFLSIIDELMRSTQRIREENQGDKVEVKEERRSDEDENSSDESRGEYDEGEDSSGEDE